LQVKHKNDTGVQLIKNEVEDLTKDTTRMRQEVKAIRRQNKLLAVTLSKVE